MLFPRHENLQATIDFSLGIMTSAQPFIAITLFCTNDAVAATCLSNPTHAFPRGSIKVISCTHRAAHVCPDLLHIPRMYARTIIEHYAQGLWGATTGIRPLSPLLTKVVSASRDKTVRVWRIVR